MGLKRTDHRTQWHRPGVEREFETGSKNDRLRRQNRILKEEREISKKGHGVLRGP